MLFTVRIRELSSELKLPMDATTARAILAALADGVDPHTGEELPDGSPYQHPNTIRALYEAIHALQSVVAPERPRPKRALPERAGIGWTPEEDRELLEAFDSGAAVGELSKRHGRTRGAIQTRLARHGRVDPPYGLPTVAPKARSGHDSRADSRVPGPLAAEDLPF